MIMPDSEMMKEAVHVSTLLYFNDKLLEQGVITTREHAEMRAWYQKKVHELLTQAGKMKRVASKEKVVETMY